jgi:hypothetical protein
VLDEPAATLLVALADGATGQVRVEGTRVRLEVDTAALDGALRHLTQFGVRSLISQPPTLEELFLRHYRDELEGALTDERSGAASSGRGVRR